MHLTEITAFKPSTETFHSALSKFADEHGLDIKDGTNAQVFVRNKPWVWRVWLNDPGFERFIEYVKEHPNNPHLPKVMSRVRTETASFKRMPKDMTVKYVKLEKLGELGESYLDTLLDELMKLKQPSSFEDLEAQAKGLGDEAVAFVQEHKKFFETFVELRKAGANDLYCQNVMTRGETFVIMDPFKG